VVTKAKQFFTFDGTLTLRDILYLISIIGIAVLWWHNTEVSLISAKTATKINTSVIDSNKEAIAVMNKQLNVLCVTTDKRMEFFTKQLDGQKSLGDAVLRLTIIMQGVQDDIKEIKSNMKSR
jgi:hypothetical protein